MRSRILRRSSSPCDSPPLRPPVPLRARYPGCVVMSARRAGDIEKLHEVITAFFQRDLVEAELFLPWAAQKLRGEVFAACQVLEERSDGEGAHLRVRGEPAAVQRLRESIARLSDAQLPQN